MNIIKTFLSLIGFATCQYINTVKFPNRPVYISKSITPEHKESIYMSMDQLFLKETENKTDNYIRIEYQNFNGGGTTMEAYSHTDGYFEVHNTIIGINRMLDPIMFQCVALHELGHAMGLDHTETGVMAPIINFTINNCFLDITNIINLWKLTKI